MNRLLRIRSNELVNAYRHQVAEQVRHIRTKTIEKTELLSLIDTLASFENLLFDEYSKAFHLETNQFMNGNKTENSEPDLNIFRLIVNDEELHKRILLSIVNLCDKKLSFKDNTPFIKYQRPDSWYVPPR